MITCPCDTERNTAQVADEIQNRLLVSQPVIKKPDTVHVDDICVIIRKFKKPDTVWMTVWQLIREVNHCDTLQPGTV